MPSQPNLPSNNVILKVTLTSNNQCYRKKIYCRIYENTLKLPYCNQYQLRLRKQQLSRGKEDENVLTILTQRAVTFV